MVAAAGIYALQIRSCHCCGPVEYKSIATLQCPVLCCVHDGWLAVHTYMQPVPA